ncbi:hypothetical protein B0H17DRAFT_387930 [Mycena rosella]|uniref:Uncharacterized protein n=1 Tax=Mycena rosella TaxID=1033263 RepID=A0AAD7CN30_MYCRO|nr:hypothetical protein B0H17DRAFT_387930 [Mycena rosella]
MLRRALVVVPVSRVSLNRPGWATRTLSWTRQYTSKLLRRHVELSVNYKTGLMHSHYSRPSRRHLKSPRHPWCSPISRSTSSPCTNTIGGLRHSGGGRKS